MFTENGRYKKSDKVENAASNSRLYKCTKCTVSIKKPIPEFGEKVVCPECGSLMTSSK